MSIEFINYELCNGCGICDEICSSDVIRIDEDTKKPLITYPEDCKSCVLCELFCPQHAIYVSPKGLVPRTSWFGLGLNIT
jgi:adenylylsulfate reductase subunit B